MEKYFTGEEAIETLIETLDGYTGYYEDLHHEAFNTDYYIIGTYRAKQALNEYGVFDAFEKITEFEEINFGNVNTDFTNPEHVANILWYILGYELMIDIGLMDMDGVANEESNKKLIEILKSELEKKGE